jgi:hypothetical protein
MSEGKNMKMSEKREAKRRFARAKKPNDGVTRRTRSFVGGLRHELREEICRMLWDGAKYREIVAAMAGKGIKMYANYLTTWLRGGYQDWLAKQERTEQGERMMASALKVVKEKQGTLIQEAGLQLASSQIYQVLMDFDPKVLKKGLNRNGYARLVQMMARLSEGELKYERYRAEVATRKEKLLKDVAEGKSGGATKELWERMEGNLNLL